MEDTTKIRQDLIDALSTHVMKHLKTTGTIWFQDMQNAHDALQEATLNQLWTMYRRFITQDEAFKILGCNPKDYLAISFAGMYCGIEPDGYLHS